MGKVDNEEFLNKIPEIFKKHESNSIYLTLKHVNLDKKSSSTNNSQINAVARLKCKKDDISTLVQDSSFVDRYNEILKNIMTDALKKKVKKVKSRQEKLKNRRIALIERQKLKKKKGLKSKKNDKLHDIQKNKSIIKSKHTTKASSKSKKDIKNSVAKLQGKPKTKSQVKPKTKSQVKPKTKSQVKPKTKSQVKPKTNSKANSKIVKKTN